MPRRPRIVIPGTPHHVTQRGNNRQTVFGSVEDRKLYLKLLSQEATRHNVQVLGWCLMTNHVHLILIPEDGASLASALGHAHSQYALALTAAKRESAIYGRTASTPVRSKDPI